MTLSIIIPVYNTGQYLRECLDSVLIQNHFNGEVICVNDGSTDNCGIILNEYSQQFSNIHVITQENKGLSVARNVGVKMAKGEYVLFLDSDDYLLPNTIDSVQKQIGHNGAQVAVGNMQIEGHALSLMTSDVISGITNGKEAMIKLTQAGVYRPNACLNICNRKFILDNKLFFEEGLFYEDELWAINVYLSAQTIFALCTRYYFYRSNPNSITQTKIAQSKLESAVKIARILYEIASSLEAPLKKSIALRAFVVQTDIARTPDIKGYGQLTIKDLWKLNLSYSGFRDCVYYLYPSSYRLTRWALRVLYFCTHWK